MHPPTLLLIALTTCAVTAVSAESVPVAITRAPRAVDPEGCPTEFLTQEGLDVPKPTGSLADEIQSYGSKLFQSCVSAAAIATAVIRTNVARCPFHAKSDWCGFTTAAPTGVLPAYSTYASQAYSWWMEHRTALNYMMIHCPDTWEHGRWRDGNGEQWFADTFNVASCYSDALTTAELAPTGPAKEGSGTTEPAATGGSSTTKVEATSLAKTDVGSANPTSTDMPSGGMGRLGAEMWVAALVGIAAVALCYVPFRTRLMNDYMEHEGYSSKTWDEAKTKSYLEGVRDNYWKATPAGPGPATYIIRLGSGDHEPIGCISYFQRNSDVSGKADVGIKEIFAAASSNNLASIRVLERLGFVPGGYVTVNSWVPSERVRFSVMVLSGMEPLNVQYIHPGYKVTESEGSEAKNDKRV
ncbi:hypothetical protein V492_00684 [Pseudogymnoascus sp. VKM F-4246]|nr:hypothetical protein V492_00684 [Pseudogymnoascus sp. VKM F-4246]